RVTGVSGGETYLSPSDTTLFYFARDKTGANTHTDSQPECVFVPVLCRSDTQTIAAVRIPRTAAIARIAYYLPLYPGAAKRVNASPYARLCSSQRLNPRATTLPLCTWTSWL